MFNNRERLVEFQQGDKTLPGYCTLHANCNVLLVWVLQCIVIIPMFLSTQLPNGVTVNAQSFQDRKVKLEELRMTLIMNFRKLRVIYNKVIENTVMFEEHPIEVRKNTWDPFIESMASIYHNGQKY